MSFLGLFQQSTENWGLKTVEMCPLSVVEAGSPKAWRQGACIPSLPCPAPMGLTAGGCIAPVSGLVRVPGPVSMSSLLVPEITLNTV